MNDYVFVTDVTCDPMTGGGGGGIHSRLVHRRSRRRRYQGFVETQCSHFQSPVHSHYKVG